MNLDEEPLFDEGGRGGICDPRCLSTDVPPGSRDWLLTPIKNDATIHEEVRKAA
jgi:hypothetical protein